MRVAQVGVECASRLLGAPGELGAPGKLGQHRRPRASGWLARRNLAELSDRNGKLHDPSAPTVSPDPRTRCGTCLEETTGTGPSELVAEDEPPLCRCHARDHVTCLRRRNGTPRWNLARVLVDSEQRG
jgi:hypothetical protein